MQVSVLLQAPVARARVPRAVSVRCQTAATSTPESVSTSGSKCPFSGILQTSKGLLRNDAAAPTIEELPTSTRVIGEKFDYTPFSGPNYQVSMHKHHSPLGLMGTGSAAGTRAVPMRNVALCCCVLQAAAPAVVCRKVGNTFATHRHNTCIALSIQHYRQLLQASYPLLFFAMLQNKYKMTMGLEPMHLDNWIEIDDAYEEEMALRKRLVAEKHDIVIHSMPGVRACTLCTCITEAVSSRHTQMIAILAGLSPSDTEYRAIRCSTCICLATSFQQVYC